MNPNLLPPGYLLFSRYSIQNSLGQGGFGITYLAYDTKLNQEVCIKELFIAGNSTRGQSKTVHSQSVKGFSFGDFVKRFVEEARKLAQFNHPNIVRILDVFQANDTAYMVMDYVHGETLKQKVQQEGALSEQVAMPLIDQLLYGVEEVHKKGMLHRDIKPDNILITDEGKLVLIDFGSAREFSDGRTITQTAMLTPGYAPMEQYSERAQRGPYTDIYALGATIYFLLTGTKPIPVTDRSFEDLIPPHDLNPKISVRLSILVMRAMEMKPENRFQRISEMSNELKIKDNILETGIEKSKHQNDIIKEIRKNVDERKKNQVHKNVFIVSVLAVFLILVYFTPDRSIPYKNPGEEDKMEPVDANRDKITQTQNSSESKKGSGELVFSLDPKVYEILSRKIIDPEGKVSQKEEPSQRVAQTIQQIEDEMVFVQGGNFLMGCTFEQGNCLLNEKPAHKVTVKSFNIGKFEVTQKQWIAVTGYNPSLFKNCNDCPVEFVSWNDVQEFLRKLNSLTGRSYRLPTEAEWEFAARGGSKSRYYKFSGSNVETLVSWGNVNSGGKTNPVGKKDPNELGIFDMSGNVWEWCSDWYGEFYYAKSPPSDPKGPTSGTHKVARGGAFNVDIENSRISNRKSNLPDDRYSGIGFRLVSSENK